MSLARLACVTVGALCFLGAGVGLGAYCFSVSRKGTPPAVAPGPSEPAPQPAVPEQPLIVLPREEQVQVDRAILRGVRYLKTTQQPNGTWADDHRVGKAALPGLVLLQCGLPARDPTVGQAADFVRQNSAALNKTYELALALLFLEQLGDPRDRELLQTLAVRLVAGQTLSGGWDYDCPLLNSKEQLQLLSTLRSLGTGSFAEWKKLHPEEEAALPGTVKDRAVFQDPAAIKEEVFKHWTGDNSNTQFAILALWAARRYDTPLERTVALLVKRYRTTQNADGSWNYMPGRDVNPPWPTMTCAGLLGLAVGHALLEGQGETVQEDPALEKAFQRVGQQIAPPGERPAGTGRVPLANLYFLWSVERVAVLFHRQTIADKDWYGWGARILLDHQDEAKGHWQDGGGYAGSTPVANTCFALLFLKQANLAKDLTSKLQLLAGGGSPGR